MQAPPLWAMILPIVVIPLLLATGYMRAYYSQLEGRVAPCTASRYWPDYRSEDLPTLIYFRPAHEVDRVIRSNYWEGRE